MESGDVVLSIYDSHVVLDNGIVMVTLSKPGGCVTDIQYGGINNLMETLNMEAHRGYWDLNWNEPGGPLKSDLIQGREFSVVVETPDQVEVSFVRNWDALSSPHNDIPLNIDIRYILLRGSSGFYAYAIYERLSGFPDCDLVQTRMVFRLRKDKFQYMAIADDKQRVMAIEDDRSPARCQTLAYPEAVLLTNPENPALKGEVDDKYQYSLDNKDGGVYGWISFDPVVGFWIIFPSHEFRNGGPTKQNLTLHAGPICLAIGDRRRKTRGQSQNEICQQGSAAGVKNRLQIEEYHKHKSWACRFPRIQKKNVRAGWTSAKTHCAPNDEKQNFSSSRVPASSRVCRINGRVRKALLCAGKMFHSGHYIGDNSCKFRNGEAWMKVLGPFYVHLNSSSEFVDPFLLWNDAKQQRLYQEEGWPYNFPASPNFLKKEERCSISGRFLVDDRFISTQVFPADSAYIGLATPGETGSWQKESKGYQFWTKTDENGFFQIVNINSGDYNIYGWVPNVVGDYKNEIVLQLSPGSSTDLGDLIYKPPRNGPTLWEIGIADRTALDFYVPDPIPKFINNLYINHPEKFRQYGLWERYADLYPENDLVYTVGVSDYTKDWFFAHVTRKRNDGTYQGTTWQIKFQLNTLIQNGSYALFISIASPTRSILQVRCNDPKVDPPHFETPLIGQDNAIARHGIHGFYQLFIMQINPYWLVHGDNTIFLTQRLDTGPFNGIIYDYIRLEEPDVPY